VNFTSGLLLPTYLFQFALWDRSELNQYKAKVDESMKLARGFVKDRNKAIEEMHEADNFVMKALKYREVSARRLYFVHSEIPPRPPQ